MKRPRLFIPHAMAILAFMIMPEETFAQDRLYVGFNTGYVDFGTWEKSGNFDQLSSENLKEFQFGIQGEKSLKNFDLRVGINYLNLNPQKTFTNEEGINKSISGSANPMIQVSSSINKKILFITQNVGLQLGLGLMLQHNFAKNFSFENDESFQVIRVPSSDSEGNPISVPAIDLTLTGFEAKGPAIAVYARPEIGFFYHLGDKGKLNLDFQYGVPLNGSIITRTYTEILFEGDTFSSKHVLPGNFYAIMIGYSLNLSQGKK